MGGTADAGGSGNRRRMSPMATAAAAGDAVNDGTSSVSTGDAPRSSSWWLPWWSPASVCG